jgi:hypothetical protein
MSAGQDTAIHSSHGYAFRGAAGTNARGPVAARARRHNDREHSLGLIITTSLSFILFAAAILLGGHAVIAPLLQGATTTRAANGTGDFVYTMPDGVFCQHMSFDNSTDEISEGDIEECPGRTVGRENRIAQFRWGTH